MSASADEVLDAIDGALDDWAVSDDAMRWVPPAERAARIGDDLTDFGREWAELLNAAFARMAQTYSLTLRNIAQAMSGWEPIGIWQDETLRVAGYTGWDAAKPSDHADVEAYAAAWLSRPATDGIGMLGALVGCSATLHRSTEPIAVRYSTPLPQSRPFMTPGGDPNESVMNRQRRRRSA